MNWLTSPPKKGGENSGIQQQKFSYNDICNSRDAADKINQTIPPGVSSPAIVTATADTSRRLIVGWKEGIKECSQLHGSLTVSKEQLSSLPNVDIDWSCPPLGCSTTAGAATNNTSKKNNESALLLKYPDLSLVSGGLEL